MQRRHTACNRGIVAHNRVSHCLAGAVDELEVRAAERPAAAEGTDIAAALRNLRGWVGRWRGGGWPFVEALGSKGEGYPESEKAENQRAVSGI